MKVSFIYFINKFSILCILNMVVYYNAVPPVEVTWSWMRQDDDYVHDEIDNIGKAAVWVLHFKIPCWNLTCSVDEKHNQENQFPAKTTQDTSWIQVKYFRNELNWLVIYDEINYSEANNSEWQYIQNSYSVFYWDINRICQWIHGCGKTEERGKWRNMWNWTNGIKRHLWLTYLLKTIWQ